MSINTIIYEQEPEHPSREITCNEKLQVTNRTPEIPNK